jgi:hypothetical protein
MADKEFTYSDVSEHTTKKDLYIVVHDKVYDASSFVDEHPYVAPSPAFYGLAHEIAHRCFETPRHCLGNTISLALEDRNR